MVLAWIFFFFLGGGGGGRAHFWSIVRRVYGPYHLLELLQWFAAQKDISSSLATTTWGRVDRKSMFGVFVLVLSYKIPGRVEIILQAFRQSTGPFVGPSLKFISHSWRFIVIKAKGDRKQSFNIINISFYRCPFVKGILCKHAIDVSYLRYLVAAIGHRRRRNLAVVKETETCMVRACHTPRQPLQNHSL